MLSTCCTWKSSIRSCATLANTANSCASHWLAVANAHAVLARFCTLKWPRRSSATLANAAKSCASCWLPVATCPAGTTDSAWEILKCPAFTFLHFVLLLPFHDLALQTNCVCQANLTVAKACYILQKLFQSLPKNFPKSF